MVIAFQDFFPIALKKGIFSNKHELLTEAVSRANAWVASSGVRVINVETVVFPNVEAEESSKSASITRGEYTTEWHQFVRVWYEGSGLEA